MAVCGTGPVAHGGVSTFMIVSDRGRGGRTMGAITSNEGQWGLLRGDDNDNDNDSASVTELSPVPLDPLLLSIAECNVSESVF